MRIIIIDGYEFSYLVRSDEYSKWTDFYYGSTSKTERCGFLWLRHREVKTPIMRFSIAYDIEDPYLSVKVIRREIKYVIKNNGIKSMVSDFTNKKVWLDTTPLVINTKKVGENLVISN